MSRFHFFYTHDNGMGYGRMGTQLHRAFVNEGHEVMDGAIFGDVRDHDKPAYVALWGALPNNCLGWYDGQYRSVVTMWEATHLPENMRTGMHNVDQILVPSEANLESFGRYHDNVHLVPLGVDPSAWHFRPRQQPRVHFRFLADGRGPRKGTDLTRRAFQLAFKGRQLDGPIPRLVLKGNRAAHYADPDTDLVTAKLSDEAEIELFAACHVYLAPTRGEGWGLQPLQAIAQGCPTILTAEHGQKMFAHLGWGLSAKLVPADYFLFGDAGNWWLPDIDEMIEHMRWIYDHYDDALLSAANYSETARSRFSWENSAKAILAHLPDLDTPFTPGKWIEPTFKKYPVIMRLPWNCEIAGRKFYFEPNKLYYERAEVKRILYEGGYLDPCCIETEGDADSGLVPWQLERLDEMSANHGCCPTCGQEFNSKPFYEFPEGGESGL